MLGLAILALVGMATSTALGAVVMADKFKCSFWRSLLICGVAAWGPLVVIGFLCAINKALAGIALVALIGYCIFGKGNPYAEHASPKYRPYRW